MQLALCILEREIAQMKEAHPVWVYTMHTYSRVHYGYLVEVKFAVLSTVNVSPLY